MKKLTFVEVARAANGRWVDYIFPAFQIETPARKGHGPCPACGGDDRFRCDDQGGGGSWYCNGCDPHAGDGFALVANVRGYTSSEVLKQVAGVLGLQDSQITDAQREQWRQEAQAKIVAAAKEKLRLEKLCGRRAKTLWSKLDNSAPSPYLARKMVDNFGGKTDSGGLFYLPMFDAEGVLWNVQTIHPDGFKSFMKTGRVLGTFHMIGDVDPDGVICIGEGYATCASVHMASGWPVAVAWNSNILMSVGRALREAYPRARLLFCADNDAHLFADNDISIDNNVGIKAATAASAAVDGCVVYPDFGYTVEEIAAARAAKQSAKDALIDAADDEVTV